MRLVGYEFSNAGGPVGGGFLPLGDLTILFGANDAGKSRLLRTIAAGADSLDALLRGGSFAGDHRFFFKLHPDDATQLLRRTYTLHIEELRAVGLEEDAGSADADGELPWLRFLPGDAQGLDPRTCTFALEALADRCGRPPGGPAGLLVSWCRNAEPLPQRTSSGATDGPVRLGTVDLPVLPWPVELPLRDPGSLRRQVADAIGDWLSHIAWGARATPDLRRLVAITDEDDFDQTWWDLAEDFRRGVEQRPPPKRLWTHENDADGSVAYRPLAHAACRFVGEIATRLAPAFVTERYEICVQPVQLLAWDPEEPLHLTVRARASELTYDAGSVADGLTLWIQIAVLEAADAMRRVELGLRHALLQIERAADPETRAVAIEHYLAELSVASTSALERPFERSLGASFALAPGIDSPYREDDEPISDAARRVAATRPRLYLLDEPERHLNPRLQRAAARWLTDLLLGSRSQALIATHAHAFLNVTPAASFVEVRRDADGFGHLLPFEPSDLTAGSQIAREVGLDMGELLTSVRLLVFVEGRHDQVVLEELFRVPLFHAGALLVPITGVGRHAQIVEHDVLIRFTRARLAVVFDKLDRATITRLQDDPEFREQQLRSRDTELQAMASLLHRAAEAGRDVQPIALPVDDIFDALDEEILTDQYPGFPGHEAANAAWEARRADSPRRKVFYEQRFGIPNRIATYRDVAALMRTLDRIPAPLRDLGANIERMAEETR